MQTTESRSDLTGMLLPLARLSPPVTNEILSTAREALGETERLRAFERQAETLRARFEAEARR